MLFTFIVLWSLDRYGQGGAEVVAPNPVEAVRLAGLTDEGWMLHESGVNLFSVKRDRLAHCHHWNGEGQGDDLFSCDDCGITYISTWENPSTPEPSATNAGFAAYCANLVPRYTDGYE